MSDAVPAPATAASALQTPRTSEQDLVTPHGIVLRVQRSGSGDPLVFVHGSWDDRQAWTFIQKDLARRFHVVSYDRRGHTDSGDSTEPGTRRDDENDLADLIETLGLAPANVVGNSFGASIALGLAARRPELFRTLCAHEPPLLALVADDPVVAEVGEVVGSVVARIQRGEVDAAARDFVEMIGPGAWEALSQEERAAMVANAHTFVGEQLDPAWAEIDLDALGSIAFPVLMTRGDQSPPFFWKVVARLVEAIDSADVRVLPGAGHEPHLTHPADYFPVISRFAAS